MGEFDDVDAVVPAVADVSLDTPNCPVCLRRMQVDATAGGTPYWSCPGCGASKVS